MMANSDEVVQNLVADRLAEHVHRDRHGRQRRSPSSRRAHLLHEKIFERLANRDSTTRARRRRSSVGKQLFRRGIERQLQRVATFADRERRASPAGRAPRWPRRSRLRSQAPSRSRETRPSRSSRPEATSRPFARIATRLQSASASLRTCELKNTVHPLVAQPQNQRTDVASAQRIQARHRFVENDELRIVQQRLRDADALQHALSKTCAAAGGARRRCPPRRAAVDASARRSAPGCRTGARSRRAAPPP